MPHTGITMPHTTPTRRQTRKNTRANLLTARRPLRRARTEGEQQRILRATNAGGLPLLGNHGRRLGTRGLDEAGPRQGLTNKLRPGGALAGGDLQAAADAATLGAADLSLGDLELMQLRLHRVEVLLELQVLLTQLQDLQVVLHHATTHHLVEVDTSRVVRLHHACQMHDGSVILRAGVSEGGVVAGSSATRVVAVGRGLQLVRVALVKGADGEESSVLASGGEGISTRGDCQRSPLGRARKDHCSDLPTSVGLCIVTLLLRKRPGLVVHSMWIPQDHAHASQLQDEASHVQTTTGNAAGHLQTKTKRETTF